MEILLKPQFTSGTVVVIGKFDGVHKGHQRLLQMAKEVSANEGLTPLAYTFESIGECITGDREKASLLGKYGVEKIYFQKFTEEFKNTTPTEFIRDLKEKFGAKHIIVGFNFRFGKNRSGDTAVMKALCNQMGLGVTIVPPVMFEGQAISSTRVRQSIKDGNMDEAFAMLGRAYCITAKVVHGKSLGASLGFPTANMQTQNITILPKSAVYATKVELFGKVYPAITNLGSNPTVDTDGVLKIETHIIGFSGDLYGKEVTVQFLRFLRMEKGFDNVSQLKSQLLEDTERAIQIFDAFNSIFCETDFLLKFQREIEL